MDSELVLLIVIAVGFWWFFNNNMMASNPVPGVGNYSGASLIAAPAVAAQEAAQTRSVFRTSNTGNTGGATPPPKNPLYQDYIIPNTNLSKKVVPYWAKPQPGTVSLKAPIK